MLGYRKRNHNTETDTSPPLPKKKTVYKKVCKVFSASSTHTNVLI